MLTQSRLKEIVEYDPNDGYFVWIERKTGRKLDGDAIGCFKFRYVHIRIEGKQYYAHRLAWLYMTGEWPPEQVDHIDNDKQNNKWSNLRLATIAENGQNKRIMENNTSGVKGVWWDKQLSRWKTGAMVNGKIHHLGYFHSKEQATEVYRNFIKQHHKEFANNG